jgi:hypothetical protein
VQIEQAGSTISQTLAGLILDIRRTKNPHPHGGQHTTSQFAGDNLTALVQSNDPRSIHLLLISYLAVNVLQLAGTLLLWSWGAHHKRRQARRAGAGAEYDPGVSPPPGDDRDAAAAVASSSEDEEGGVGPSVVAHIRAEGSWADRTRPLIAPPRTASPHQRRYARYLLDPGQSHGPGTGRVTVAEERRGRVGVVVFLGVVLFTWVLFMGTAIVKLREKSTDGRS